MSKQTAVEWLVEQLEEKGDMRETSSIRNVQLNIDTSDYLLLKKQALAMEKEQIVGAVDGFPLDKRHLDGEQYYNETYGGQQ